VIESYPDEKQHYRRSIMKKWQFLATLAVTGTALSANPFGSAVAEPQISPVQTTVPSNGIKPELGQTYFVTSPGETVVVPLTVSVGDHFDGRVGLTQHINSHIPLVVRGGSHWVSGIYTNCSVNRSNRVLSYTHLPGEKRDHTMMLTIPQNTEVGQYACSISAIAAGKTYTLPFVIDVR